MSEQKSEKPTPQRLRKAREKGQFPAAKEFVSAAQFFVIATVISMSVSAWWEQSKRGMAHSLEAAFQPSLTGPDMLLMIQQTVIGAFLPLAPAAALLLGVTLLFQLGATNMGFSLNKLTPNFSRINPMGRLKDITRQNIPQAVQALVVLMLVAWTLYSIGSEQMELLMALPLASVDAGVRTMASAGESVMWRGAGILFTVGVIEMFRHRWLYNEDLSMTKQEVRQEHKDQEGDPHIKARVRRLRRELLRKQMLQEVPTASVVLVNPTHYAVAIRYDATMASPKVVAKGRNLVAGRIKALATEHDVPIVENPPLARALYKSVEVGREVPPDFFRAIAEVLAYVYRMTGRRP